MPSLAVTLLHGLTVILLPEGSSRFFLSGQKGGAGWLQQGHEVSAGLRRIATYNLLAQQCRSSPDRNKGASDRRERAQGRSKALKSLPGEGAGEASEVVGQIQTSANASRRLRVLSVRHLP